MPEAYLNLWYEEQGFVRLYFYATKMEVYQLPCIKDEVVCELFFSKKTADSEAIECSFIENGFERYRVYHKWIGKK